MDDHIPEATRRVWMNELMQHLCEVLQFVAIRRFGLACGLKKFLQTRLFLSWPTRVPGFNGFWMYAQVLDCANPFNQRTKQQTGGKQVALANQFTNAQRDAHGLRDQLCRSLLHRRELATECAVRQTRVDLHR